MANIIADFTKFGVVDGWSIGDDGVKFTLYPVGDEFQTYFHIVNDGDFYNISLSAFDDEDELAHNSVRLSKESAETIFTVKQPAPGIVDVSDIVAQFIPDAHQATSSVLHRYLKQAVRTSDNHKLVVFLEDAGLQIIPDRNNFATGRKFVEGHLLAVTVADNRDTYNVSIYADDAEDKPVLVSTTSYARPLSEHSLYAILSDIRRQETIFESKPSSKLSQGISVL